MVGFLSRRHNGKGPHLTLRGESPDFSQVVAGNLGFLLSYDGDLRDSLVLPQESQVSMLVRGFSVFLSSCCRVLGPHLELRLEPQVSSPVLTGISGISVEFQQGRKALSSAQTHKSALLSSCNSGVRLPV